MNKLELKIDFNVLGDLANRSARRAAAFVALGHKAWSDESITSVKLEAPFGVQMLPDPMPKELAEEVRGSFRQWVIGHALAEIVQGLALFANQFYEVAVYLSLNGQKVPQEALDRIRRLGNDTNLSSKFKTIEEDTGFKCPIMEHTEGWSKARNAHAHNRGIVRPRDYTHGTDELIVSWRQNEILIEGKVIENIIGHYVEKDTVLEMRMGTKNKTFKVDTLVDLSEQEVLHLCLTTHIYASAMVQELQTRLQTLLGVKENPAT